MHIFGTSRYFTFSLMVFAIGCGNASSNLPTCYPVSGKVLIDGKPAVRATVVFHPQAPWDDGKLYGGQTLTGDNGDFRLTTFSAGDGVPTGEYIVTIIAPWVSKNGQDVAVPDLLNQRYATPDKSPLKVQVEQSPLELPPFELTSD